MGLTPPHFPTPPRPLAGAARQLRVRGSRVQIPPSRLEQTNASQPLSLARIVLCRESSPLQSSLFSYHCSMFEFDGFERGPTTSFACRFRDGPFDAYETSGGCHVQAARPQLRDLARRVRRRPSPGTEGPT